MKLKTDRISWSADAQGENLVIGCKGARAALAEIEDGKTYTVEIKPYHPRRSLDANAYAWTLIDKIAEKTGEPKTEVYRSAIREIGGNSDTVCVLERAADKLCEGWSKNGVGWLTERMPSKIDGCVNVTLYYGSSTYDTAQMSRLIDLLVQDAKQLGIETLTPAELERMGIVGQKRL